MCSIKGEDGLSAISKRYLARQRCTGLKWLNALKNVLGGIIAMRVYRVRYGLSGKSGLSPHGTSAKPLALLESGLYHDVGKTRQPRPMQRIGQQYVDLEPMPQSKPPRVGA